LAYYVKTGVEAYSDSGYLSTQAGVPKDKLKAAIKIIISEYKRIASEKVELSELKRAQDLLAGRLLMQLEASDEVASWYGRQAVLRKKYFNPQELEKKIRQVTVTDILKVAQMVVKTQNLNLAVIGPVASQQQNSLLKMLKF
jgi:predicted Zn-dependent peptidase